MKDYFTEPIPNISQLVDKSVTISKIIKAFFYSLGLQKKGEKRSSPFISTNGVYASTRDREVLSQKFEDPSYIEYNENEIDKYFKEYVGGFKYGYWHFEEEILLLKDSLFNNDENKRSLIFDYLLDNRESMGKLSESQESKEHLFANWFIDGMNTGYYYRALYIVFLDHRNFLPLFEKRFRLKDNAEKKISVDNKPAKIKSNNEYEDFDDLFKIPENKDAAYQALIDAGLMTEDFKFRKLKSAFAQWVKDLYKHRLIHPVSFNEYGSLINNKIKKLGLTYDNERKIGKRARAYTPDFDAVFSKLSRKK